MAIIKCKMCGGDLNIIEGATVAECEYCGTKQTVPSADNEKKLTLFGRAGRLLRSCEFDKAAGVFESIVTDFPEEAEAYWGLVLCKYGIEYVDDPATGKKIPTCHRSSFESVLDDENFDQACENADPVARRLYREEAKAIEELRRGIIEVSGKEAPYDIFICYKETDENGDRTLDSVLAQDIYDALTEKGYRVFFSRVTLEDKLGQEYEPYIFAALNSAKVMLAVGTDYDYYNAVWVKNEWSRFLQLIAGGQKKTLIPCYKNIDAYDMPKEFAKLQAQDLGKVGAMQDLLRGVDKLMGKDRLSARSSFSSPTVDSLYKRGQIYLEDGEWDKADEYFDKVLDIDPENARAYFGKLLAVRKLKNSDGFVRQARKIDSDPLFQKALRYADASYMGSLLRMQEKIEERMTFLAKVNKCTKASRYIAAGYCFSAGLKTDGTIEAAGPYIDDYCDVSGLTDIVAVEAGSDSGAFGLRSNGTVVISEKAGDECSYDRLSKWKDIVSIKCDNDRYVGLKSDGTVAASYGILDRAWFYQVFDWTDIAALGIGTFHVVGLRRDGTVVASGNKEFCKGGCDVSDWSDIVAIDASGYVTVGLRGDGTVVVAGEVATFSNDENERIIREISSWKDIVAVTVGDTFVAGLRSDGTVVIAINTTANFTDEELHDIREEIHSWRDIVALAACGHILGLKSDGTVVAVRVGTPPDDDGKYCDVSDWKLFNDINTVEQEQKEARIASEKRKS